MPAFVLRPGAAPESLVGEPTIEAFRGCALADYEKKKIPSFAVNEEIIAYASPDSTYAVTKRLLDSAKKSILIGIYDFTAAHMKTILLNALARGVKVTLMLDVETAGGEEDLFNELIELGVDGVRAPACTSARAHYFASCHEKFIIVDGLWTLVQSGNYSNNSIPLNEQDGGDPDAFVNGNRDTGLAVKSRSLAKFFTEVLRSDIALELNAPEGVVERVLPEEADVSWVEAVPKGIPSQLFSSKTFTLTESLTVQPVLSPDNYMSTMPDVLKAAKRSILIEQQYIRGSQPDISILLASIAEALVANPQLDVRIVLGKIFGPDDLKKEQKNLDLLKTKYGLKLGPNIRYINTNRLVHCHNKLIVIDGRQVLVSSQNWSDFAVSKNREAGLLFSHKGIAKYFTAIFESDWSTAFSKLPKFGPPRVELATLRDGGYIQVVPADYREV
jgi:phosphatidylserine/phosphatidylglycerophosphate/cardiolipin synthase-like enzyme